MARIRDTSYDKSVVYEPSEDSFLLADAVFEELWSREKRNQSNALRRLDDDDENDEEEEDDSKSASTTSKAKTKYGEAALMKFEKQKKELLEKQKLAYEKAFRKK